MNQDNKHIPESISDQDFDHLFKSQLEQHEVTPDSKNWIKINNWSDFSIFYDLSKFNLLKIAAVLLFIITATTLFIKYDKNGHQPLVAQNEVEEIMTSPEEPIISESQESDENEFIFDFKKDEADKELKKQLIDKKLDDYLAFLLEDEDEFASAIDSSEISKSLEPVERLPLDEMFAYLPTLPKQEEITILAPLETKITLPHRFVKSEKEIEDYLIIYETNKRSDR